MTIRQYVRFRAPALTLLAAATTAALIPIWHAHHQHANLPAAAPGSHEIDVVFAIDTTASMGGLIDNAKATVWKIARHIHESDPQAELRVGLVAYRDLGDDYVTRDYPLSTNLDGVFAELATYQANGGGDIPEDIDAALYDAVHKMSWRADAHKMIFIVGDAPPATRGDVPAIDDSARAAAADHIAVNTIRCGWDPDAQDAFQRIAALGGGEYWSVQEDGGTAKIATPYDARIGELGLAIDGSEVFYGTHAARSRHAAELAAAAAAPPAAKADRAAFYASEGKGGPRGAGDVVGAFATGGIAPAALDPAQLPPELEHATTVELQRELAARAAARAAAEAEIRELTAKRTAYVKAQVAADSFDERIDTTIDHELTK